MEQTVECLLCKKAEARRSWWWRKKENVKPPEPSGCYPFTALGPEEVGCQDLILIKSSMLISKS